tara:strand:- start:859 stop:1155 length:297 start_codon:yes stop_codon:yes gene_type:complete
MTDDQILEAAKAINTKRKLSEYHKELYGKVVRVLKDTDPDAAHKPLRIREQSSLTIQTIQVANDHCSSVEFRLNADLSKELLNSLEYLLSNKDYHYGN